MHHGKGVHRSCFVADSNPRAPGSALCLYPKSPASRPDAQTLLEVPLLAQCRVIGRHNPAYVFSAKEHLLAAAARLAHGRGQPRASACTIRGAGVSRFSGPLPPALLTNAFANPLEVCAAGATIMTPSYLLLQRTSLYCAKMPLSIGRRRGGNGNSHWCIGSPRRSLGANLALLSAREEKAPA
jgi:hypothetical protein